MTTPAVVPLSDLGLPPELLAHLAERGITKPTPIQAAVIPLALAGIAGTGGDLLAQARTGSGKTLAYLLPLAVAMRHHGCTRAWVVCPTRELAQQVAREAVLVLGPHTVATLIGGAPWGLQARELSSKPFLVVGTPGRMRDHLDRGTLKSDAEILILDEADQMLDMGFKEELDALVKDLGEGIARWLFSATFPPAVAHAVERWLDKPREVRLDVQQASSHVPQKFVIAHRGHELTALVRLLQVLEPPRSLVFTRTRLGVDETVQAIALAGIEAAGISGDLTQDARERVLGRFRSGKLPVLVATDVAARGLDVQGVSHVFNLGLPVGAASYSHRIGRTARAGAEGEAWSVFSPSERSRFLRMAAVGGSRPVAAQVPTGAEIVSARRKRLATRVEESLGEGLTLPAEFASLTTQHGAEAVLAAMLHRLVPDAPVEKERVLSAPPERPAAANDILFMSVGEIDGVTPAVIVAMICRSANIRSSQLGRMRIFARHTLLGVSSAVREAVLSSSIHYKGRQVMIRPDAAQRGAGHAPSGHATHAAPSPRGVEPMRAERRPAASDSATPVRSAPASPAVARPPEPAAVPPPAPSPRPAASIRPPETADHDHRQRSAARMAPPTDAVTPAATAPVAPARPAASPPPAAASRPAAPRPAPSAPSAPSNGESADHAAVATLRIALGRDSGVSVRTLRKFLCKAGRINKTLIGDITMSEESTVVSLPREVAHAILRDRGGQLEVQEKTVGVTLEPG